MAEGHGLLSWNMSGLENRNPLLLPWIVSKLRRAISGFIPLSSSAYLDFSSWWDPLTPSLILYLSGTDKNLTSTEGPWLPLQSVAYVKVNRGLLGEMALTVFSVVSAGSLFSHTLHDQHLGMLCWLFDSQVRLHASYNHSSVSDCS